MYPREGKCLLTQKPLHNVHSCLVCDSQDQPQGPAAGEWLNKLGHIPHVVEHYWVLEKEKMIGMCNNIGKTPGK